MNNFKVIYDKATEIHKEMEELLRLCSENNVNDSDIECLQEVKNLLQNTKDLLQLAMGSFAVTEAQRVLNQSTTKRI